MLKLYVRLKNTLYTKVMSRKFLSWGQNSYIKPFADMVLGECFISIGDKTIIGRHIQLTAWGQNEKRTRPIICIGSECQIGSYNHITAVNSIKIGQGVLTGKFVTITENSHGDTKNALETDMSPIKRKVYSKGSVIIGDNVWIGDKATVLPNVIIGKGSIIGANSVVTKDIPPYSIAAGNPATVVKKIK